MKELSGIVVINKNSLTHGRVVALSVISLPRSQKQSFHFINSRIIPTSFHICVMISVPIGGGGFSLIRHRYQSLDFEFVCRHRQDFLALINSFLWGLDEDFVYMSLIHLDELKPSDERKTEICRIFLTLVEGFVVRATLKDEKTTHKVPLIHRKKHQPKVYFCCPCFLLLCKTFFLQLNGTKWWMFKVRFWVLLNADKKEKEMFYQYYDVVNSSTCK